MPLVGTSGHVNHGKSRLIEALTGTNPDRLPEERERGMTVDLGFAWFPDRDGRPVGVIDVPGHERFLRNMTAGAWSLDCALLVVAADDGWMAQTESHAKVLETLGVPRILPVITKIDLVSAARRAEVEAEVRSNCGRRFGVDRPCVEVSAPSGIGIDELKDAILEELGRAPAQKDGKRPYFYVDRVFTLKGAGLVVAGSLRGGSIRQGDELVLRPRGERVRVRALHSYNAAVQEVLPGNRVAVNIAQLKDPPVRGDCLAHPAAPVLSEAEFLARLFDAEEIRNHREAEIAFGSAHMRAAIHFLGSTSAARIVLERKAAVLPGERFLLLRRGGSDILGWGYALWFGPTAQKDRWRFAAFAAGWTEGHSSRAAIETAMRGYYGPLDRDAEEPFSAIRIGTWLFDAGFLREEENAVLSRAEKSGFAAEAELQGVVRVPEEALRVILGKLVKEGRLKVRDRLYAPQCSSASLSKSAAGLLESLAAAGRNGFEPSKASMPFPKEDLSFLCRAGMVVPLENGIYLHAETYRELRGAALFGRRPGDRFSIPEAKEATGLSRKYIIPLLNRMERDGFVRRQGDERVVEKLP